MAKKPKRKKPAAWSKVVEAYGIRIRLYERGGTIYRDVILGRVASEKSGKLRTKHDVKSLGHADRERAEDQAKALAARIAEMRLTGASPSPELRASKSRRVVTLW